jgi:TRAP-type uncharacterized transport system substrate-binding protein
MTVDNKQATVMNILVANASLPDQVVYNIVKTFFDQRADLILAHKEAENIKYETQKTAASPIPWHPGALKYFKEKGVNLN